MSELTPEELALLKASEPGPAPRKTGRRKAVAPAPPVAPAAAPAEPARARGPHTPRQFDDDGWGSLPVQMRH